ncbi:MAG: universal stress protein [Cyclobacteriaceae bacterium]
MDNKSQILVLIDFNNVSIEALDYAAHIAQQTNKKVIVINVINSGHNEFRLPFNINFTLDRNPISSFSTYKEYKRNKKKLKDLKLSWNNDHAISKALVHVTSESPLDTVMKLVDHYEPFMLVVPYTKHSDFQQYFSSSFTLDILRKIKIPTLFIPEGTVLKKIENIVFPSGFSEEVNLDFLHVIKRITNAFNSNLHLVKILEDHEQAIDAEIKMRDFAHRKSLRNYQINCIMAEEVHKALGVYQQSVKADLLCLMTKGKSGVSQLFYSNSITESLLKNTNKPILSMTLKDNKETYKTMGHQQMTNSFINELTY